MSDEECFKRELALAELAEPLGFDSIWQPEHHFSDYEMTPNVIQFLTYMAGRTKHVRLGSMVCDEEEACACVASGEQQDRRPITANAAPALSAKRFAVIISLRST